MMNDLNSFDDDDDYNPWNGGMFNDFSSRQSASSAQHNISKDGLTAELTRSRSSLHADQADLDDLKRQVFALSSTENVSEMNQVLEKISELYPASISDVLKSVDTDQIPPLCYAACFGNLSMCQLLVEHGCSVDQQDKQGWTPLAWAMNNGHDDVAEFLKSKGALLTTNMKDSGLTVGAFMNSMNSEHAYSQNFNIETIGRHDFYKSAFDFRGLENELSQTVGAGLGSGVYVHDSETTDLQEEIQIPDDVIESDIFALRNSKSNSSLSKKSIDNESFDFNHCQPHQMMVFERKQIPTIISMVCTNLRIPHVTRSSNAAKFATANTIYLCARYAHYYSEKTTLSELFNSFFTEARNVIDNPNMSNDLSFHAYWLANLSQLLYYLRKDPAILNSFFGYETSLIPLIQSVYHHLVVETRDRLLKTCIESIGSYDSVQLSHGKLEKRSKSAKSSIDGLDGNSGSNGGFLKILGIKKVSEPSLDKDILDSPLNDTSSVEKKRSSSDSSSSRVSGKLTKFFMSAMRPNPPKTLSPRTLLTHLASTMFVLQSYMLHPFYQSQIIEQQIYTLGSELFNAYLDERIPCCRSKGLSVRMNLTVVEEWLRQHLISSNPRSPHSPKSGKPRERTAVDGLLKPFFIDDIERYLSPLQPAISICKLLQVITTGFNTDRIKNESTEKILTNLMETIKTKGFYHHDQFFGDKVDSALNWEQLLRLLRDNYLYEKNEDSISQKLVIILEKNAEEFNRSLANKPATSSSKSSLDLMSFEEPIQSGNEISKRKFYLESKFLLPLKIQSGIIGFKVGTADVDNQAGWGDKNQREEALERLELSKRVKKAATDHWESVKIEVPDWILKSLK